MITQDILRYPRSEGRGLRLLLQCITLKKLTTTTKGIVIGIPEDATAQPGHEWHRALLRPQVFHDPC